MTCLAGQTGDPRLVGDPINVISGANIDRGLDFRLEGPLPLEWFRHYNSSQSPIRRSLGWGHGHEFDRWLRFDLDGMRYLGPDGEETAFPFLETDGAREVRGGLALERVERGLYRIAQGARPVSEFRFNAFDRPVPVTRVFLGDKAITLKYGNGYRLESVIDSLGRWIEIKYDEAARTQTFHLHETLGKPPRPLLAYRFDAAGNLVEGMDPYRNVFSFRYDARNLMTARVDRRGYTFHFEYDSKGRCIRSAGEDGVEEVRLRYTEGEGVTEVIRADGGKWTYFHDESGFLYQIIDPYGGVKAFKADEEKRTTEELDPNGNATKVVYDEAGNPIGKVSAFGRFAPHGEEIPDPLHHRVPATPLQYELGDLLPREAIRTPTWKSEVVEALPATLQRHFRIIPRPRAEPGQDQSEADAAALDAATPYKPVRDPSGRVTKETAPGRPARAWAYDKNGNVAAHRDLDGSVTKYEYASWNHLVREMDPLGRETRYAYDRAEKLTQVVGPGGARSDYEYDLKNRLLRVRRHGRVREEYSYDLADNLVEKKDGKGKILLSMEIGKGNQIKTRRLSTGENHHFKYDERGRYVEAATDAFKATFAYDKEGGRTEDLRDGRGVRHKYAAGQLAETAVLDKFKITYVRKQPGQLAIRLPGGKAIQVRMLGNGLVLKELPNASREWVQYDSDGRILSKVASGPERYGQEWVRRFTYSDEGNLLEEMDTRYGAVGYAYDAAHRLVAETTPNGRKADYVLDAGDNLVEKPGLSGVTMLEGNRLSTANGDAFEYDDRNQMAVRKGANGDTCYAYDSRGFLTGVTSPGKAWSAEYDPLGRRVRKTVDGGTWEFYWDSDRLAAEIDPKGRVRVYVYSDAFAITPLAFLDYKDLAADPASGKAYYLFTSHQGSPSLVEDEAGHPVWSARIEPYGQAQVALGADFHMPLRFPGHYWDAETGLHYNRFRYYSPELGRYLQSDPEGIGGGLNLYGYAEGNPLRWVDVRGLQCPKHKVVSDPECVDCQADEKTKVKDPKVFDDAINDPRYPTLKVDPQTGKSTPRDRMEAVTVLQAESEGVVTNPRRTDKNKDPNHDFLIDPPPGKSPPHYCEIKTPIDPKTRSIKDQASDIAGHVQPDRSRPIADNVTNVVDLRNLSPADKTAFVQELKNLGVDTSKLKFLNT